MRKIARVLTLSAAVAAATLSGQAASAAPRNDATTMTWVANGSSIINTAASPFNASLACYGPRPISPNGAYTTCDAGREARAGVECRGAAGNRFWVWGQKTRNSVAFCPSGHARIAMGMDVS